MRSRRSFFAAALLAAIAIPLGAQPGSPPDEPASAFGEEIDVRVVNVEVVVTDRQGNRVTGLGPGDFRLRVDGREVPVEYFTEVRGGRATAAAAEAAQGAEAAGAPVQGLPELAPGTPVGTSYLVFVDDYFSIANRRDEVLRALMDDLGRLGPEDRMAVVAFDGRRLDMVRNWSGNQRELHRAFQQAMGRPAYGFQRLAELRSFQTSRRIGTLGTVDSRSAFANSLDLEERAYIEQLADQVRRSVVAAVSTLRGFASPPGRKVMILLSGGWPYSPADYVINNPNRPIVNRDVPGGEALFRPLVDTANLLGYTLYPVDVPGVEGVGPDASEGAPRDLGLLDLREQEIHASLQVLARQTGGRALLNSLRSEALETAEGDTRSYYWLGFTPERQRNDERHEIRVEVLRPGLEVRARDNYLDLSRRSEGAMVVESALLFGNPPNAASMPIEVGRPERTGRREMEVPITVAIPVSAVTAVPLDGRYVVEAELRISALDEKGNRSEVPLIPLRFTAEAPPQEGAHIRYDARIRLRRARQHLVVALFDPLSGRVTTAEADVAPDRAP